MADARPWGLMGILWDPGREASSIPGVLSVPSVTWLWLCLSDFIHRTSVLCLVVWGWGRGGDADIQRSLPKSLSFPPLIAKWFHTIGKGGPKDITSDRNIWEGVKRTLWFSPLLSGTDDNGNLVTMAHRGEMIQLHQLLHYHQEWWEGAKDRIHFNQLFLWFG